MSHLWQHPYVNVFKHFNLQSWKKSTKEGEVSTVMDKTLKCTVYRVTGSIPAGNYIQLPKAQSQSLGLTGRYFYLLFKPIPTKYFVVHIDVATQDNLIVRISFSNLFKEFKSTSTWLQFPFLCNASRGSVQAYASVGSKDHSGPAPMSTRWTVLCLDMNYILSMYLNRKFSYIKNVKLCANMLVKNMCTSDLLYEVGLTFEQAKKAGRVSHDVTPMPRDLAFPLLKGDKWDDLYDMIRFPNEGSRKPFDSIQFENIENSAVSEESSINSSQRVVPKKVDVSKCVSERISLIHNMTQPRQKAMKRIQVTKELPMIGVDDVDIHRDDEGEIHVFAHPTDDVVIHQDDRLTGESINVEKIRGTAHVPATRKTNYTALEPDPILKLRRIVGFGGATFKDALWSVDGSTVVYPCHAVVVAMKVSNGHQRFFIGHTDKVSCISMTGNSTMLASGQTGNLSVVRVWKFNTGDCLAMCKTHVHSLHCLSFAHKGNMLCGVGKDSQGKNMVVIWNTSKVMKNREITVTAKAHTDVDIVRLRVSAFDDTSVNGLPEYRMVSCGRDNVRLWRVKEGQLRSAPVNLGEHHSMEFTDVAFEAGYHANKDPSDRLVYACSRSGHIFEIELQKVAIRHVRRLLPNASKSKDKDKQTFRSGPGIGLNCMSVNETFCVTGSDDGYLRLWPLDFAHVYLEAEHEGPVTSADFSSDGLHILAGTATGNLGMLDVTTRSYTTMMRSHTGRITGVAVDPYRKHLATVSEDHTIRVWDSETLQQLYDFSAPSECPCTISYHPSRQIFACGFENGIVRVFNVQTTSMMAEHKQHRGKVIGLSFAPTGDFLFSACSLGSLALYDATADNFPLLRLLANTVARGERRGPQALSVSPDGRRMAFIGPSEFIVSVVDSKSLDEVLRIDISNISASDSGKAVLDSAMRVYFAPQSLGHLLVTTANNKLLKFDARTGRILAEVNNIHRSGCSTLTVTDNGRYLATGGDKTIKIWDYNMKLDINFQVFIGHSENVSKIVFTPDSKNLLSVGEAVYMWDFLAVRPSSPTEGREIREMAFPFMDKTESFDDIINVSYRQDLPRTPPKPIMKSPGDHRAHYSSSRQSKTASFSRIDDLSSIHKPSTETEFSDKDEPVLPVPEVRQKYDTTSDSDSVDLEPRTGLGSRSKVQQHKKRTPVKKKKAPSRGRTPKKDRNTDSQKPTCKKHFRQRERFYGLAQRRYIAPPNQAGVNLKSIIGYNGNAKNSLIWQSDTGLFVYTTGCVLIVEDLNTGDQKHLTGHTEEISTLSLQNDCQVLASASGSFGMSPSQIIIWDLEQYLCRKVLNHHEFDIQCLAYSRDDRFLISVGDYRDCSIVVWSTDNYEILTTSRAASPVHELKWDPYTVNEFATVGQNSTVLFWLLDETTTDVCLNVHEAEVPEELLEGHHKDVESVDFTAMEYAGDSTLYISTSSGKVSAWDTRHNTCFIHWEADKSEIDVIMCRSGRLLTGSVGKNLRVWSIVGVGELKLPGDHNSMRTGGLTMEDEMNLDGSIVTAAFDEALDMGIIGTSSGTLWYINWPERTSIRLVSSHMAKVNNLSLCNSEHFASCADDGSVRVWSIDTREQTLQFQVLDQACTCIAFSPVKPDGIVRTTVSNTDSAPVTAHQKIDAKFMPLIAAGYSDGTVRVFDINKAEMILKMHPHAVAVTAISFSSDGRMVITGGSEGLIAVSSPTTGMTVRVISDHKGAPITNIDVSVCQEQELSVSAPQLWLATSADRRVSVWSADWSKDFCELVDWLTFPAPAFTPDGTVIAKQDQKALYSQLPPSIAKFSPEESDIIVYVGYGMEKCIQFYSLSERKVLRTQALTHWPTCMDLAQSTALVSLGANERVMKLLDYYEGSFQDFVGHSDSINFVKFSPDSKYLLTVSHSEIFIWEVQV